MLRALALLVVACAAAGAEPAAPAAATAAPATAASDPPAPAAAPTPQGTSALQSVGRWLNPTTAPFIPIPEVDVDPHSGVTLGVIPTWLRTNDRNEIERIIAPDVFHSQYFGWGSRMRVFAFPEPDTQWSVVGGLKQRVEREFDGRYNAGLTRTTSYSWSIAAVYDRSGTLRFFGVGNDSPAANETSYINNQAFVELRLARNFSRELQLAYVTRVRAVEVLHESINGLPSIEMLFPQLPGLGKEHELPQSAVLTYDTRDSPTVPHSGGRYAVYGGFASRKFGSSVAYSYTGIDARHYWELGRDAILAWHAGMRYMPSAAEAPFWALSSLGGDRSVVNQREPLRSFGADRYMDRHLFATGVELRVSVARFAAFGTRVNLELDPFLDAGKVFPTTDTSLVSHLHAAPGVGVRAVANPFVVGYLDIGFYAGKAAVFSGIDYPF